MLTLARGVGPMALGERIKELRKARGWNQTDLAARAGLRQGTIANLETGARDNPTQETLDKLARAFDIPIAELLGVDPILAGPWPVATIQPLGLSEEFLMKYRRLWPHAGIEDRRWMLGFFRIVADAERRVREWESAAADEEPDGGPFPASAQGPPVPTCVVT